MPTADDNDGKKDEPNFTHSHDKPNPYEAMPELQSTNMRVNIILPQIFLPQDSIKLGRIITSLEHPYQNYHDPPATSQPRVLISLRNSYTGEQHVTSKSGFGSTLTSLVSADFSKRTKMKIRVTTDHVKTYILENSDHWFEQATHLEATRAWIERAVDQGHDMYMVVGIHTVTDAIVNQESVVGRDASGQIKIPLSQSLAGAGIIAPLGDIIDPGVAFQQQGLNGAQSRFIVPGEQVCALEYRKIRLRWLSSKRLDKSRLSNVHQWPTIERSRDEEDGEDDIIQVELVDVQAPDGIWDRIDVEDESLFIRSFDES